ncbi:MAG: 23S rRNA (uracil(1939)-C(5))-methyltransferase RlmD, partial [Clostridia bacterium]|nr:23S rRNA (uracil(1939)-C(5))-methyltransferase RlmD [Clostridia bacterium]
MKKNDLINVKIQDLGVNGEGIARAEGYTFFAPFSLPGEVVEVKALKVKKNIVFGKVERVISPSISRVSPRCPIFFKCGGCQMQHVDYAEQLQVKKATVENCFKKIAGISLSIDKAVPSFREYGYRNKLQLPLRRQSGKNKIGFFRSASHDVVETDTCPIHPKWADDVIACIKDYVGRSGERLYDESDFSGSLRHLVVREINGEFLFTLVVNGSKLKDVDLLVDILKEKFEKFSVYINENRSRDNVILGDRFELVYGNGSVTLTEFGVTYSIGPQAFFQVNTPVKEAIYSDVLSLVDNNTAVIDAYAGAGV